MIPRQWDQESKPGRPRGVAVEKCATLARSPKSLQRVLSGAGLPSEWVSELRHTMKNGSQQSAAKLPAGVSHRKGAGSRTCLGASGGLWNRVRVDGGPSPSRCPGLRSVAASARDALRLEIHLQLPPDPWELSCRHHPRHSRVGRFPYTPRNPRHPSSHPVPISTKKVLYGFDTKSVR